MGSNSNVDIGRLGNQTYVVGREGHIFINDPTVSKKHAEIQIKNGEIYLRDLESTNGTYLLKNKRLVPFKEGYVQLNQPIVMGNRHHTIHELLDIAGVFAA